VGVEMSPNQGQGWSLMAGGIGNPLILDLRTSTNVNPAAGGGTPNGAQGRIVLAVPAVVIPIVISRGGSAPPKTSTNCPIAAAAC